MALDPKKALSSKREKRGLYRECAVSTGSTLINLACTDHPDFGFLKGGYYFLVGDSTSGKTWLSLTCFAESTLNEHFKNYRLIFDDVEGGALMDIEQYFGKEVAKRMEPPALKKGKPVYSDTIESLYYHLWDLIKAGIPFIYVLDSQDALDSKAAREKFLKQKKAREEGQDAKGSMGDGKAKYHSEHLRQILSEVRKMGSIVIFIGQTRDNLGMGFNPKTRSGGKALRFYANLELWSSVVGKIVKKIRGREREVGIKVLIEVKKNRVTGKIGKDRAATVQIRNGLGIDDIASNVDFLITEKHWIPSKDGTRKIYKADDLGISGSKTELIDQIESEDLEGRLKKIVAKVWHEIEAECQPNRKKRYV